MHPILFSLGKISIYSHGVLVALGLIVGGWIIYILAKQENLSTTKLLDLLLFSVLAGLVGARLNYILVYHDQFTNLWDYLAIWRGGMVSYGGLIAGFGTAIFVLKKQRENVWQWLDIGIIGLMIGWTFGRIGCFLAGDLVGKTTQFSFGLTFPVIDNLRRHPIALYEAFATLIIFGLLLFLHKNRSLKDGVIFFIGLWFYFVARFAIEFTREYPTAFSGLSLSQIVLIILAVVAAGGVTLRYRSSK